MLYVVAMLMSWYEVSNAEILWTILLRIIFAWLVLSLRTTKRSKVQKKYRRTISQSRYKNSANMSNTMLKEIISFLTVVSVPLSVRLSP